MRTKPLIHPRFDPLIWCGTCFLISVVSFWWPVFTIMLGPDAKDPNVNIGRAVWYGVVLTSPFILATATGSIVAFRKLYIMERRTNAQTDYCMIGAGAAFTLGSLLPLLSIITLLLIFFLQRR